MIQLTNTHRICPLGAYLSFDPVNKILSYIGHLVTPTDGRVIQAHSESKSLNQEELDDE